MNKEQKALNEELMGEQSLTTGHNELTEDEMKALHTDLNKLRTHFASESGETFAILRVAYLNSDKNRFIRRSFQLSMLGIIWSKLFEFDHLKKFNFSGSALEFDVDNAADVWRIFKESHKESIIEWIEDFQLSRCFQKEALISEDLWGAGHKSDAKIHCRSQYSVENIKPIGQKFYTDLAVVADGEGLPLMLFEIAANPRMYIGIHKSKGYDSLHKDLKKLAIHMAGTAAIDRSYKERNLRVFGALISGTEIEFCVSRPYIDKEGKIAIVFETHQDIWTFDLFGAEISFDPIPENLFEGATCPGAEAGNQEITEFDSKELTEPESDAEDSAELLGKQTTISEPPSGRKPYGKFNATAVSSITKFINHCHLYYASLPAEIADIYLNPENYEHDPDLVFPKGIHCLLHTTAGETPLLAQKQLRKFTENKDKEQNQ